MHPNGLSFFDTLLNWAPALLLMLVYVFFLMRMRSPKFQAEYLEEMRKQTGIFERIADALEKQGRA